MEVSPKTVKFNRRSFIAATAVAPIAGVAVARAGVHTMEGDTSEPTALERLRAAFAEINRIGQETAPAGYEYTGVFAMGDKMMLQALNPADRKDGRCLFVHKGDDWVAV